MKSEKNNLPHIHEDIAAITLFGLYMQFREKTQYFHGKRWKPLQAASARQNINVWNNHCYESFGSRVFKEITDEQIRKFLIPFEAGINGLKKWEGIMIRGLFGRMNDFYKACLNEFPPEQEQDEPEVNHNGQMHIPGLEPKKQSKPEPSKPEVEITSEELMGTAVMGRGDGLGTFADVLDVMIKWAAESYYQPERKHTGEFEIATRRRNKILDLYEQYLEAHVDRVSSS